MMNIFNGTTSIVSSGAGITINGKKYSGSNLIMNGNDIYIDGKLVNDDEVVNAKSVTINIVGNVESIKTAHNVSVQGNVGSVNASGSVDCGDVSGDVDAGGSVTCKNVEGDVDAGGSIHCGNIKGDVDAGGAIYCRK